MAPPLSEHTFPPALNSTSEASFGRNMPWCSCSSSFHLPTQLLQLYPLRSAFIHTTILIFDSTHCCSPNKRSQSKRLHHTYTEAIALASHLRPYRVQNLHPHVYIISTLEPLHHTYPWLRHVLLPTL